MILNNQILIRFNITHAILNRPRFLPHFMIRANNLTISDNVTL